MTAATATKPAAKTVTKPATKAKAPTAPKPAKAADIGKSATTAKPTATAAETVTSTNTARTKPAPPSRVAEYIATLTGDEQRYARKVWRHATGQRGTAPSLRGITQARAKSIREQVEAAARP